MRAEAEPKPHSRRNESARGAPVAHSVAWVGLFSLGELGAASRERSRLRWAIKESHTVAVGRGAVVRSNTGCSKLLNGELFLHIDEMRYVVEHWRMDYNHYRPHSRLRYMTPAGFAQRCRAAACIRQYTSVPDGVRDGEIL
jgi:transposase InsO family protein